MTQKKCGNCSRKEKKDVFHDIAIFQKDKTKPSGLKSSCKDSINKIQLLKRHEKEALNPKPQKAKDNTKDGIDGSFAHDLCNLILSKRW